MLATLAHAAESPRRPNVLFIFLDDLRPELGCYGVAGIRTPHIDRLAAQSVRFAHAYTQYPLCNPSRTSLLTGRYPTVTGVLDNRTWFGALHPDWKTLPRWFKDHGYATLRAGKIFHAGIDDTEAWREGGEPRRLPDDASERLDGRDRDPNVKQPDQTGNRHHGRSVTTDRWHYVEWNEGQSRRMLLDRANDPGELRNLAEDAAHAARVTDAPRPLREAAADGGGAEPGKPESIQSPRKIGNTALACRCSEGHGHLMAWRIDEEVVRGEFENRTRGRVTGRIWFVGRATPVELDLAGNACRDLAGRRLEFVNPRPKAGDIAGIANEQRGVIGDCTASRKVRVPEIPMEEIGAYYAAKRPFPWHWGNSLYLEWFSTANGRVVIENAAFQLTLAPDAAWEMTPAEEAAQRRANAEAAANFLERIADVAGAEDPKNDAPEGAPLSDSGRPMSEEEAERMQEESDRLADRVNARVDREGVENYERILEEELERRRRERGEKPLTPEQEAERAEWIEEMNRAAEEALNNTDPEIEEEVNRKHPLAEQVFELSLRLHREAEKRGWIPANSNEEHPVADLVASVMSAGAKFAGALNGRWPPDVEVCASAIVRLKRARGYVDHALLAAEFCSQQNLAEAVWLALVQRELNAVGHECDMIIGELRAKLDRGFD